MQKLVSLTAKGTLFLSKIPPRGAAKRIILNMSSKNDNAMQYMNSFNLLSNISMINTPEMSIDEGYYSLKNITLCYS